MKVHEIVLKLLREDKRYRENDTLLCFKVWSLKGLAKQQDDKIVAVSLEAIHKQIIPFESITRARRKLQEIHPELQASIQILDQRTQLSIQARETKGNSIAYRD